MMICMIWKETVHKNRAQKHIIHKNNITWFGEGMCARFDTLGRKYMGRIYL